MIDRLDKKSFRVSAFRTWVGNQKGQSHIIHMDTQGTQINNIHTYLCLARFIINVTHNRVIYFII